MPDQTVGIAWGAGAGYSCCVLTVVSSEKVPDLQPMEGGYFPHVEILELTGSPYTENLIFASDLHKDLVPVLDHLETVIAPEEWIFVSAGDMAGTTRFGEDGNPSKGYERIRDTFKAFYFVAGNHDILAPEVYERNNPDGTFCDLARPGAQTIGGKAFLGQHGIIANKKKINRLSLDDFSKPFESAANIHTVVTHQPVLVEGFEPEIRPCGLEPVIQKLAPEIHILGHCRVDPPIVTSGQTTYINCDSRVLLLPKQ